MTMKNGRKTYVPEVVDLSDVTLPAALDELLEQIARNVHDVWARSRMDEGWTYGPERDDEARTHPGLVPYEELSESEKDYDRNTALNTLKLVMKMGYDIRKRDEKPGDDKRLQNNNL